MPSIWDKLQCFQSNKLRGHRTSTLCWLCSLLINIGEFQLISRCKHNTHNVAVRQARISMLMLER